VTAVAQAAPESASAIAAAASQIVPSGTEQFKSAAERVSVLNAKNKDDKGGKGNGNGNGNSNNGGNGKGNGNGADTGKGTDGNPDKPGLGKGRGSVNRGPKDKPPTLPNGKPRPEHPKTPHHGKPSDKPHHYNRPHHN
jgi:hypothetical protein